ncbi:MAG: type II secretion system minor pseudopilin GspK [Candidatus Desulfofervidaceae bacterium]|nr:type II secretion system minor pseudopilin GspK [Candidatus Desulfofervidaceae bacterium]
MRHNNQGTILLLTLVILAILSTLIIEFSYTIYTSINAFHNWEQGQKLSYIAQSGIKLGTQFIKETLKQTQINQSVMVLSPELGSPLVGEILKEENLTLQIEDENAKFNLNKLVSLNGLANQGAYEALCRLLNQLHLSSEIADRIVDWIDPDHEPRIDDSEEEAQNAPLDSIDELCIIPGIKPEACEKLLPYVTIYSNGLININTASKPVLKCLSKDITADLAKRIIDHRQINPFEKAADIMKVTGFENLGLSLIGKVSVKGSVFEIKSIAASGGIKKEIICVVDCSHTPPIVKYWKEF